MMGCILVPNISKVGPYNLKGRIFSVGGELGELIPQFRKRGIFATNAEITNALKGRYTCKKGQTVLENGK